MNVNCYEILIYIKIRYINASNKLCLYFLMTLTM